MIRYGLLLLGIVAVGVATEVNSSEWIQCRSPFLEVGGHCVHLSYKVNGTWEEMRQYCQELGGDLVKLADLRFYGDIILYLNNLNLPNVNFWIGATDQENEGYWLWTDGTPVTMGTPYWFVEINMQSPFFGSDYNCGCINYFEYYYFRDCVCNSTTLSPICQAVM